MISDVEYPTKFTTNHKKIITNDVLLEIILMVHGDITGKLATERGNKSKPIRSQLNLLIMPQMH